MACSPGGSDASRVYIPVRCNVVDLTTRDTDVRKLGVRQVTQLATQPVAFAPLLKCIPICFERSVAGQGDRGELSLPFCQRSFKWRWIWRLAGRTTSVLTISVFARYRISIQEAGEGQPKRFGLSLAHWKLTLGCGFAATLAAACHFINVGLERTVDPKYEISEGFRLLRLALSIETMPRHWARLGNATAAICGDFDAGKELVDRAVALNPNVSVHGAIGVGLTR